MSKHLDMRTHRYEGEKGTPIVLLSIYVPNNMVLLSDSDMWNNILNDGYLELYEKDEYLRLLIDDILPKAKEMIEGESGFTGITGYSLAGLFAVYAMYKTEVNEKPIP